MLFYPFENNTEQKHNIYGPKSEISKEISSPNSSQIDLY